MAAKEKKPGSTAVRGAAGPDARRIRYKRPPIQEALCELRFESTTAWTPAIPGAFYEGIRPEYGGLPRMQEALHAGLHIAPQNAASFSVRPGVQKTQFSTADGKRIVALGPHLLSVHILRPYEGWFEDFRPRLERALALYRRVVGDEPVRRIGLRYINRIVVTEPQINIGDYFRFQPVGPPDWPTDVGALSIAAQFRYGEKPVEMRVLFATEQPAQDPGVGFVLDLDLYRSWDHEPLPVSQALREVDDMRALERTAFESVLTDKTRAMFEPMD